MLAIQNQISVLKRILDTKIQNEQIVEYQRAVSATLDKVTSPKPTRSRKTSSNQDPSGGVQSVGKDKKAISNSSNHSAEGLKEVHAINFVESNNNDESENHVIPESTGCTVS